jgi:ABC-type oligopeptide transport system ATPase subunit
LITLVEGAQNARKLHAFLKSLHFKQIKERQFEVKSAHTNTFEWIFKEESLKFSQWLRSDNDIFWIAGKAGSGKSTLMKFLCKHYRTDKLLSQWAGSRNIVIASHFFWSAGTSIQKSQRGLLRALLFQILVHTPSLIPLICPKHWNEGYSTSTYLIEPWELADIFQALENLASMDQLPANFCLFIDGLDEYDGDHAEIIRIINRLAQSPQIKLCVSSRPWTVFVDAFDKSQWKLYLQDLTRNDIRLYIKDNLEEDPRFLELKRREAIASELLVQQITKRHREPFYGCTL